MSIDLAARIPNNVDLASDPRLQRALEAWQPKYVDWWKEVGPVGFQRADVYLRTAIDVGAEGWANFDYVKMPDYRWGIFLATPEEDRRIGFGDHAGEPVWHDVPGEHRAALRRLIVTQADTEPASVEQQARLGATCPSLYDLRNLFQVNVEEGRHLWAMVYLLHRYFGRDGRDEGDELLARRAGSSEKPRILETFNQPVEDWLDFFFFTMFTDRDGKFQLLALAESAFDPLARSCQFMLTEEAHHLFVGETGIDRVIRRSAELTRLDPNGEASRQGGIDLAVIQRYLNHWFSSCLDLFGGEVSSNAANSFATGLKGRPHERKFADHDERAGVRLLEVADGTRLISREVPARLALNEDARDGYIHDCQRAVDRWNKTLAEAGLDARLSLPSRRFHRALGEHAGRWYDPSGTPISAADFLRQQHAWLPTHADRVAVRAVQGTQAVTTPGQFASWIAPPARGIDGQPLAFEYVRLGA
ncbi:MAG: benzoyl-CoA 2,3-epoxidase subunit BoxB [Kofleriaceae bacterium]|jgi:benzoyl-CoA 2,3-dioxygenase component B|nr:benzoyl-CoA 2,3-epoxidase subunit BoxB [Kofleriaceae bacterium]MBP6838413.1 benzoyl-CoA 2,3-epoxidase subunit BoxB [Kofleriaceae bacterium]MBP9203441.1 benzoyl-CoA 2,3-epoxidase subunit BoxB [Kofleriaceae bacterium]